MRKKASIFFLFIALLFIAVLVLRKKDLTIYIIAESSDAACSIRFKLDDQTLFEGNVNSGVYFGEKIVVEDMGIGFHTLKVEALKDNVIYQKDSFILFNKTIIVTYFDRSSTEKDPYFDIWSKFGKFLPD
jgi:hypothetical protein